ncbi:MAG: hypothetical protein O3B13_05565 [Planctomycetota bacterium]|nr:hypothetical protein [Planctomycetota bacterium]
MFHLKTCLCYGMIRRNPEPASKDVAAFVLCVVRSMVASTSFDLHAIRSDDENSEQP